MAKSRVRSDKPKRAEPLYRIGMVARKTGVSTHTLRAWERRYGSISPDRSAGGGRLYSERDIARLRLLKQLTEQGHAIGAIAALPLEGLSELVASERAESSSASGTLSHALFEERFLHAISEFDVATASRVLSQAALLVPPRELVSEVLAPIFHEIGARWESGAMTVAHEHAASALLRSELGTLLRSLGNQETKRVALATTLSGEQHEFGSLLAALFAAAHGWRVVYLGANLPSADIVSAAKKARAKLVLVSVVNDLEKDGERALEQLRAALPEAVTLCVGGRGTGRKASARGAIRYVHSLRELAPLLEAGRA